ncbi:MAG: S8 family serine peptidase, partial [Candidatus Krumholzibacteriaceae bacterium]
MKKALCIGIVFVVLLAASPFGLFAQQADLNQLSRDITAKNSADRAEAYRIAAQNGWPTRGYGRDDSYFELQKMLNGIPAVYTTFNADAARSTNTDSTNFAIGGGAGFVLRIWDGGAPRITHQELTGRVTWNDALPYSSNIIGHATHTAGTLVAAGVVPQAKGMAYAATLRAFEWTNDTGEMSTEASAGMNLSSHSYGYIAGWTYNTTNSYWYWYGDTAISDQTDYHFGFYDSEAQIVDQIANAAPNYLPVVAASNDRGEGPTSQPIKHYYYDTRYGTWRFSTKTRQLDGGTTGYDCIPYGMQLSKNSLTVGAVMDVPTYTGPSSVVMTSFSSWGPADDGRIKPDIVGNGWQLYSSWSTSDVSYATASGTSMATPNVCGSLALLEKYYKDTHGGTAMWASTLKALAIHTARECGPNPGPDYMFGWGLLNTYAAYKLLNKDYLDDSKGFIEQFTLSQGQTMDIGYRVPSGSPELRATICWDDPAGTPTSPSLNPRTRMLVNDLDLRALKGASTYYPWHLDVYNPSNAATQADNNVDNVEQVVLSTPAPGVYTIRISHKGTLSGGSQKFSLIVSGAAKNHSWNVYADGSGDAATITAAVSIAADGDSIFVHQGTYHEAGISVGKALYIRGVDGASLTTVDGSALGASCFIFPAVSKVISFSDFTIKNGLSSLLGGGVNCSNSSVTFNRCVIKSCSAAYYGGGMAVTNASPTVKNCTFLSNHANQSGAGLFLSSSSAVFDTCVFRGNVAVTAGGGIDVVSSTPQFHNCTVDSNYAGTSGGGVNIGSTGNPTLTRCIVSSGGGGGGGGIFGEPAATGATITCCDVYGNAGGNYGGSISDRTGTSSNISKDPVYCTPGAYPPVLTISSLSPCAPALSPCGQLIGALAVACLKGPDLVIAGYDFTSREPAYGDSIRATVKIKNLGQTAATKSFYVDYYEDLASPPAGVPGDQRLLVAGLAAGDSVTWVTAWAKAAVFKEWMSYFRVDTGDSILETSEGNDVTGPIAIAWQIPRQPGWPVVTGYGFHSSPAIASLDSNETTLETVVGCDNGKLYVLKSDGTNAAGWPVTIGDTLFSSPAVGDITGDYHKEIVIGGKDGKIYAFNYLGTKLWEHATGSPIYRTPALADLNRDGKCEVLARSRDSLYVLTGDGH